MIKQQLKKTKDGGVPEWPKGADCKSVTLVSMVRIHLPPPEERINLVYSFFMWKKRIKSYKEEKVIK